MIENKYLIMIGAIVCVLILYYFYDEIASTKKIVIPSYQKTMQLEAKLLDLEKKTNDLILKTASSKPPKHRKKIPDSPALSITYQSDMLNKNNNQGIIYADFSETEANEIRRKLELMGQNKPRGPSPIKSPSLNKSFGSPNKSSIPHNKLSPRKSDSDIFDFMSFKKEEQPQSTSQTQIRLTSPGSAKPTRTRPNYQDILNNLSTDLTVIASEEKSELYSSIFDSEVAKCISDSVNCADLGQTNLSEISEIPVTTETAQEPPKSVKKINRTLLNKKLIKNHK
jgi:hypothetical protein